MARVIGFISILVALALLLCAASPSPHPTEESHATATQHQNTASPIPTHSDQPSAKPTTAPTGNYSYTYYYPVPVAESPPVWFQVFTTLVLLAFTGGLWRTSILQWRAIEKQAKIANKSLRIAQKAIIGVRTIHFQLAKKPIAIVVIENYGRSAAKNVRPQVRGYLDTDPPERTDYITQSKQLPPAREQILGEIIPGGPNWIEIEVDKEFTDEWIASIKKKEMFVYIVGRVLYHDGFQETELPLFCYWIDIDHPEMMRPVWRPPADAAKTT